MAVNYIYDMKFFRYFFRRKKRIIPAFSPDVYKTIKTIIENGKEIDDKTKEKTSLKFHPASNTYILELEDIFKNMKDAKTIIIKLPGNGVYKPSVSIDPENFDQIVKLERVYKAVNIEELNLNGCADETK